MNHPTDMPPHVCERPARAPGALLGQIHIEEDFDALPDDLLAAMEAEDCYSALPARG